MDFDSSFNSWDLISGCFKKNLDLLILLILFHFSFKLLHLGVIDLRFLNPNVVKETVNCTRTCCFVEDDDDDKQEHCDEDEVFDVMTLRKLVRIERQRSNDAYLELEKERMASKTAADEAMGMILRLQNEKCVVELEAQQYRRLSHEKQLHDQEVIRSLRWIVMKHESERSLIEDRLRMCKQRLMICMNDGDGDDDDDGFDLSLSYLDERLVSSIDLGLSPW